MFDGPKGENEAIRHVVILARISQLSNISLEVGESKREPFMIGIRVKNRHIYD